MRGINTVDTDSNRRLTHSVTEPFIGLTIEDLSNQINDYCKENGITIQTISHTETLNQDNDRFYTAIIVYNKR